MNDLHRQVEELLTQARVLIKERRHRDALALVDNQNGEAEPDLGRWLEVCRSAFSWHALAMEGEHAQGLDDAVAAVEKLAHLGLEPQLAWLRYAAGFAMGLTGNLEMGLRWISRAIETARTRGDREVLRAAIANYASLLGLAGDHETADVQYRACEDLWCDDVQAGTAPTDGRIRSAMLNNWAFSLLMWVSSLPLADARVAQIAGRALACSDEALSLTPDPDHARWTARSLSHRGRALAFLGRWAEAEQCYLRCQDVWDANRRVRAVAMAGYAHVMAETGRFSEGRALLERAFEQAPQDLLDPAMDLVIEARVALETRARSLEGLAYWSSQQYQRVKAQYLARLAATLRQTERLAAVEREQSVERERAEAALQRVNTAHEAAAWHDLLTGLPIRSLGRLQLQQALASAEPQTTVVVYVDVDRFKDVNEQLGQSAGDEALRLLAARLRESLGPGELICRLAGDQFMWVMRGAADLVQVTHRIDRFRSLIQQSFIVDGAAVHLSFSCGVALGNQGTLSADADLLMTQAEVALQEAKKLGPGQTLCHSPPMSQRRLERTLLRQALGQALERSEFVLHYQPKIDLRNGRPTGAEALLRWRRPDGRLASPLEFIAEAEFSGLIVSIGRWVLHEACRQAASWNAQAGVALSVAVNLSAVQFVNGAVIRDIEDALASSGLDPRLLEIELTESVLLGQGDEIEKILDGLRHLAVQRSIDDFGTGYSNLAYIKRFETDKLKIDRSFVENMLSNERDRRLVRAIIDMARDLQIRTVAEGVEEPALADALRDMGCDEVQGFLYARPMASADFDKWLREALC